MFRELINAAKGRVTCRRALSRVQSRPGCLARPGLPQKPPAMRTLPLTLLNQSALSTCCYSNVLVLLAWHYVNVLLLQSLLLLIDLLLLIAQGLNPHMVH